MKCPFCQGELPATHIPANCPACGQPLNLGSPTNPVGTEPTTGWSTLFMALKCLGLVVIVIFGAIMLLMAIAFAGCLFSGLKL